jgi:hypothetical protein
LDLADVEAALDRFARRNHDLAKDAAHIFETLTRGQGPDAIRQASVQEWLWYVLPTKYLNYEPGYMGRLAGVAADLFDELGLVRYAAICRSEITAAIHEAYDRSESEGLEAMRRAAEASGISPPDIDDFAWGSVMGVEEAMASFAVQDVLESAICSGDVVVGKTGWRGRQREVAAAVLDSDHPDQPGQSWRTAITTDRIQTWVDGASRRSEALYRLRSAVANRLLHPIGPPDGVAEAMTPIVGFLTKFGTQQPLTPAGYLNSDIVKELHHAIEWQFQGDWLISPYSNTTPRRELDSHLLHTVRKWLESAGALRKRNKALLRTRQGAAAADDPEAAWELLTRRLATGTWEEFIAETVGLELIHHDGVVEESAIFESAAEIADDCGWYMEGAEETVPPSKWHVESAFRSSSAILGACGLLKTGGSWQNRWLSLTDVGKTTLLAMLRASAAGPKDEIW